MATGHELENDLWDKEKEPNYSYTDKEVETNKKYVYYLQTIDKSNLKSDKSQQITLESNHFKPESVLGSLTGTQNREKDK